MKSSLGSRALWVPIVLLWMLARVGAPAAGAQTLIDGVSYNTSTPNETLSATFTVPDGGVTTNGYSGYVLVNVTGVGQSYANVFNDAFYLYSDQFSSAISNGHDGGFYQLTFDTNTLTGDRSRNAVNFIYGGLPAYNPLHNYTFVLNTGLSTPGQLHFGISDLGFSDNTGAFTIQVSQLVQAPACPGITTFTLNEGTTTGGYNPVGTVCLSGPAPAGGAAVHLSCDYRTAVPIDSWVTVPAGRTSVTFDVSTNPVASNRTVHLTAACGGNTAAATLTVVPTAVADFTVDSDWTTGGWNPTGIITLTAPAPAGGIAVKLSSTDRTAAPINSWVTVPAGAWQAIFGVSTVPVTANHTALLTATLNGSATTSVVVIPTAVAVFTVAPGPVRGGCNPTGTVTLTAPAPPGGVTLHMFSANRAAVPIDTYVTVPAGQWRVSFPVSTHPVASVQRVQLTANLNGTSQALTLAVLP